MTVYPFGTRHTPDMIADLSARAMPRFAANLSMMFQEVPFLERFSALKLHF